MAACYWCKREINRGTELQKSIATYVTKEAVHESSVETSHGWETDYGWDRPAGKHPAASGSQVPNPPGQLIRMCSYKCFRLHEKRQLRGGDPITGRGMGSIPTAYEVTALTANKDDLKLLGITEEQARSMTTSQYSERVQAARARARETGQATESWGFKAQERAREDAERKARDQQESTRQNRDQDPGYEEPKETDWRDQTSIDVENVPVPIIPTLIEEE